MAGARRMIRGSGCDRWVSLAAMCCLAAATACTSAPPRTPAAAAATTATATSTAVPDWRQIPVAPLGTELTALYSGLHEILYFQDVHPAADPPEPGEKAPSTDCYRPNGPPPTILNHASEDYVLCFQHDRLARVEAVLNLPAAAASALAQRLCDAWLPGSLAGTRGEAACSGRSSDVAFRVRLRPAAASGTALVIVVYTPEGT